MPWSAEHKARSRTRIIEAAGRAFRRHGRAGIGVDGVLKESGLTAGAFYGHFKSKDVLFQEVLATALARLAAGIRRFREGAPEQGSWLGRFAAYYLSAAHRADVEGGCGLPSLSADVARAGPGASRVYEEGLRAVLAEMKEGGLPRDDAWTTLALALGGVTLTRALPPGEFAEEAARAIERAMGQLETGASCAVAVDFQTLMARPDGCAE
jgi:AcrR family transcriptional regulator